ncbi:Smr/MutS family protein [Massilia sp. TS11]|uniref:Smr/MutS family protein n=1 Tax=Massilia sp. TS11 TaxID=2908003 RepID=UPI001EDA6BEC|nr:Smr/MutS family protein [Massilia sp. TS11]MCG2584372.1 Smr/MutS family protein [Massilia sp. TS11]
MAGLKDFADLKSLREQLKEQERVRLQQEAERKRREEQERQEANLFRSAIGGVKKLPDSGKLDPHLVQRAQPLPARPLSQEEQAEDDAAVLRASLSDQFDVEGLLDDDPTLNFSREGVAKSTMKRLRQGYWPVQDELDLHGMRRDAAREAVSDFVGRSTRRNLRCVRIIYGKGYGSAGGEPVLRSMVHSWLVQKDDVVAFCVPGREAGGHGALIVLLKAAFRD